MELFALPLLSCSMQPMLGKTWGHIWQNGCCLPVAIWSICQIFLKTKNQEVQAQKKVPMWSFRSFVPFTYFGVLDSKGVAAQQLCHKHLPSLPSCCQCDSPFVWRAAMGLGEQASAFACSWALLGLGPCLWLECNPQIPLAITHGGPAGQMEEATIMFHTRAQEQNFKKYATSLQNTSNFEESTFQEIVAEELARLKKTMISLQCHPCWSNHGIQKTSQSVCTCFGLPASRGVDFKGSQTCEWQMHFWWFGSACEQQRCTRSCGSMVFC